MKVELKKGDKIFNHGDMANQSGFGKVLEIVKDKCGTEVFIRMDDGREFSVGIGSFSDKYLGNGLTRFVKFEAYKEYRDEMLKALQKRFSDPNDLDILNQIKS